MDEQFEKEMEKLLEEQAKQCAEEQCITDEKESLITKIKDKLNGFKDYISSTKFSFKCKEVADKYNADATIVKNGFISGILNKIANVLGFTITLTGDLIQYAISFITCVITNIVYFSCNVLLKLTNLLTLGCGDY